MKLLACFAVSFILLSACGPSSGSQDLGYQESHKMPKLPSVESKKPKLPLKASVLDAFDDKKPNLPDDTKMILAEIDKDVRRLNITRDDILRGWYYGPEKDKKYGTPEDWIWIEDGETSRWVSPGFLDKEFHERNRKLCNNTGGSYVISCLESESADCRYVQKTGCSCPGGTGWDDEDGCVKRPAIPDLPDESAAPDSPDSSE